MSGAYDMSTPRSPEPQRPQAYTDFLFRTQEWEFGGKQLRVPVSGYASGKLALFYGFPHLEAFAADLSENAEVLDVGAGVSPLGVDVCRLRPDIRWTSADLFYRDEEVYDRMRADSPPNLTLLPADAVDLSASTNGKQYDRVLSAYLYVHLWQAGSGPVLATARQMLGSTAAEGKLSVGPVKSDLGKPGQEDRYIITGHAITMGAPDNDEALETSALLIAQATKLPRVAIRALAGTEN